MHIVSVICGGLLLLAIAYGSARLMGRPFRALLPGYLLVWLACAVVNMWIGVTQAGYGVMEEALILVVIFGAPAAAAVVLARRG